MQAKQTLGACVRVCVCVLCVNLVSLSVRRNGIKTCGCGADFGVAYICIRYVISLLPYNLSVCV